MKISKNLIEDQLRILECQLPKMIDSDYVYLDFPGHFNVGDILISVGAFELLKRVPFKCLYKSNSILVDFSRIPENAVILLHGGGNFGSLYRGANLFRNEIVSRFPNNKIVFLPQSIFYDSEELILKDAEIYSKHNNLTIIARDNESFATMNKYFSRNHIAKLPDTALGLYRTIPIKTKITKSILYFKREDKELGIELFDDGDNVTISDWNDVLDTFFFKCQFFGLKIISKLRRVFGNKIDRFNDLQNFYLLKIMHPYCVNKAIKYFLEYDKVFTTRLHGAILCMLLNIEFEILDTKYKKLTIILIPGKNMKNNVPILIVMTPIRNEAWVLHAFLKATSLWADYIIIADQQSTDGSREIALSYPKVTLIDNNNPDFNEAERQKLLIDKAREIEGDKILFGLDADEIFSANFQETEDWNKIVTSKPGDVFWFKWAEIRPDKKTYWESEKTYYPWVFHDDGNEPHGNYVRNMHSMRIPYPIEEKQMYYVNDFRVLHLAYLSTTRVEAKRRFYKFVDWEMNKRSIITLSRSYCQTKKTEKIYTLPPFFLYSKEINGFDLFELINTKSNMHWFDNYIVNRLPFHKPEEIYKLDLWDKEFLNKYQVKDKRKLQYKLLHYYLEKTQLYKNNILIRIIDKLLKNFFR